MDMLTNSLPLLKVAASFACMMAGIRLRAGIGASIAAGSLLLALLFGRSPLDWLHFAGLALTDEKTLFLSAIIALILLLSGAMERTGQAGRLMESMAGMLRGPRLRLIFFPALIGLLPMPGGAIFSAPMVKGAAEGMPLTGVQKVALNYWFRHIWELCWPLYPGIILASSLSGLTIGDLVGLLWFGPLLSLSIGWFFFLRSGEFRAPARAEEPRRYGEALWQGLPLITAIVGAIGFEAGMSWILPGVPYEWGVIVALAAAVAVIGLQNRMSLKTLGSLLVGKGLVNMLVVVAAVFVYKETLGQCGAVESIAAMAQGNLALIAAAVFLPFLVGFLSGITLAYVGSSFPLLLALLPRMGLEQHLPAFIVLGIFSGFTGVMVSPIHICFVLTCEYFETDFGRAWRALLFPAGLLFCCGLGYFYWLLG